MRTILIPAIVLALGGGTVAEAATQGAVNRARTVRQIAIVNTRALDWGRLIPGATAGTATVNATTDVRTRTGGVTLAGGTPQAARFTVSGTPTIVARITVGAAPVLTRSGGGATMNASNMTLNGGRSRRVPASGTLDVRVGGRLNVRANQADGLYTGTLTITVDYL
jgi:Mat/Ecp fimbriae major subunit